MPRHRSPMAERSRSVHALRPRFAPSSLPPASNNPWSSCSRTSTGPTLVRVACCTSSSPISGERRCWSSVRPHVVIEEIASDVAVLTLDGLDDDAVAELLSAALPDDVPLPPGAASALRSFTGGNAYAVHVLAAELAREPQQASAASDVMATAHERDRGHRAPRGPSRRHDEEPCSRPACAPGIDFDPVHIGTAADMTFDEVLVALEPARVERLVVATTRNRSRSRMPSSARACTAGSPRGSAPPLISPSGRPSARRTSTTPARGSAPSPITSPRRSRSVMPPQRSRPQSGPPTRRPPTRV